MPKAKTKDAPESELTVVELLKPLPKVDWERTTSLSDLVAWFEERTQRTKWLAGDEGDRFGRAYLRALEALTDPLERARACLRFDTRMGPYIPYGEMSTRWQMLQGRYDFQYFGSINHQLPGHQAYLQRGSKAAADLLVKRAVT